MEKEVSFAVELAVSLIAISLVISIVWFTVYLGNEIKGDAFGSATSMVSDLESGVLRDLIGQENVMTTATAYNILRTYGRVIPKLTCRIEGKQTNLTIETPCVITHMTGKVSLEVKESESKWIEVIIHKEGCTWYYSSCNCSSIR